jgi:hypothetical protein
MTDTVEKLPHFQNHAILGYRKMHYLHLDSPLEAITGGRFFLIPFET